jgi:glycosyltransferase involved in cell wall biosynthesis
MMKILFLCGREASYPLNQFLIDSIRQFADLDVPLENGSGKSILQRSLSVMLKASPKILSGYYDLIFVGFFGHFLMLPFHPIANQKVIFHPFISAYETLVEDRQHYSKNSLPARLAFWLDRISCKNSSHILLDTKANIDYFSQTFGIPGSRFSKIFIGSDERLFSPRLYDRVGNKSIVLFHGSYLPLQGIDVIIEAAHLLEGRGDILFRMVGRGLGYERIFSIAQTLGLQNIEFLDSVPVDQLPNLIAKADICLGGHFGISAKANRVIAGKTFQDIAMGKATIVGDTSANHELLTHRLDAWFTPTGNAQALAEAIQVLSDDPELRAFLGSNARRTFLENASLKVLTPQVKELVERVAAS